MGGTLTAAKFGEPIICQECKRHIGYAPYFRSEYLCIDCNWGMKETMMKNWLQYKVLCRLCGKKHLISSSHDDLCRACQKKPAKERSNKA